MAKGSGGSSSASSSAPASGSDPRMPEAARKYVPGLGRVGPGGSISPDEDLPPIDVSSLVGIVAGVIGVTMKQKLFCWIALLLAAQALANMRSADNDLKQIMCCFSFAVMGLVSTYFGPQHPGTVGETAASS